MDYATTVLLDGRFDALHGALTADPYNLLAYVNRERMGALVWSTDLARWAQAHAEDMAGNDYYAHSSYPVGENIAKGVVTVKRVHLLWMRSEGHRANILAPHYRVMGAGYCRAHWVEMFGL
jgi:uncharacterized protein YkwD